MKCVYAILFFLAVSCAAFAQQFLTHAAVADTFFARQPMCTFNPPTTNGIKNEQVVPQNFYTLHFGFFCRQELKMQEAHVPVTFRLGSMDYCNYLEQKGQTSSR